MTPERLSEYVIEGGPELPFAVHPGVYTDAELFELEQQHIFAKTWTFLTLESEVAKPHDFITTHIGRTPILVTRGKEGRVGAFINACRHKGSLVCALGKGNARLHVCPYHAWSFSSSGKLVAIRDMASSDYSDAFKAGDHDLVSLARVESYRGFVFGSLSEDVPDLADFLGDMRFFIDLIVDRYPQGIEFVPGSTTYTYRGNWKLQLENGMDAYHLNTAHKTFLDIVGGRRGGVGNREVKEVNWQFSERRQGIFSFEHGHTLLWVQEAGTADRPDDVAAEKMRPVVGDLKADWMKRGRNYYFFPNMQIQDSQSLMMRVFRPLAVDLTEMSTYCIAPIDEPDDLRNWRLRQYEDFFNVSGLATPDDSVIYEWCQEGSSAPGLPHMQGYARGASAIRPGADALAEETGISPVTSYSGPFSLYSETGAYEPYRVWARMLMAGLAEQAETDA